MLTGSLKSKSLFVVLVLVSSFTQRLRADSPTQQKSGPGSGNTAADAFVIAAAQLPRRVPRQQREEDEMREKMEKEQAKKLNEERFENLKRDTDKLLKLSTELKEYVDKANKDTLSLDVIKKAEEIEKLAKSVKEKMKGSY